MATIYLHHDRHFDLVVDESGDDTSTVVVGDAQYESLGTYTVQSRTGDELRHKIGVDAVANFTVIETPLAGDTVLPIELLHLAETLTDRHAAADAITGVSGDDAKLAGRLAALLGVDVVAEPTTPQEA